MMADLVNEHMGDDRAQRIPVLGPIIEDGPAIEEDHVGKRSRMGQLLAMREAHALEKAEQIEFALGLHLVEHVVVGKVLDPDDDIAGRDRERLRQARISIGGQRIQVLERGRFEDVQFMQRKPVAAQKSNPSADIAFTVV